MRKLFFALLVSCQLLNYPFTPPHVHQSILPQFVVVIPSYNNVQWYKKNLDSVFNQTYPHYRIIYIDDASPDKTAEHVENYLKEQNLANKVTLIKNEIRQGPLYNRYHAIHSCLDTEIIVMVDGDDWLAHHHVLETLAKVYADKALWMTYGRSIRWCRHCIQSNTSNLYFNSNQCKHKEGLGWCRPLPHQEIITQNLWREHISYIQRNKGGWIFGALRSYYAWLFKKIDAADLKINGQFFGRGSDVATTVPMAEMAGYHIQFINEVLYIYNQDATLNEHDYWEDGNRTMYRLSLQRKYNPLDS